MKNLTLKVAVVAVAMFAGFGASAQPWTATKANYTAGTDTTGGVPAMTATSFVTKGKPMPFWVWPSAAYNPSYGATTPVDAAGFNTVVGITTNVVSTFGWTATDFTPAATGNYVELTWANIGDKIITVTEKPGTNICNGVPTRYKIKVIEEPWVSLDAGTTEFSIPNVIAYGCEGDAALQNYIVKVNFNNAEELYPYHLQTGYKVYTANNLDGSGNIVLGSATAVGTPAFSVTTGTAATPIIITAGTDLVASHTYATESVSSVPKITIYEFEVTGWNGLISRKSDYINFRDVVKKAMTPISTGATGNAQNFTYYTSKQNVADVTKNYIIVFPKPVTGPIYHIANSFAN